jgi:ABC-type dipeptide/oligopeptide/nickel transport system ATPase subunit
MIEVKDLQVVFSRDHGQVHALRGVSFHVAEGEAFGLVGESGSGKSTVLRAICGLVDSWRGDIRIAKELQGTRRTMSFYKRVQMVFQDPYGSLHPRHSVERILAEPALIQHLPNVDQRVTKTLLEMGLPAAFRFRYPHQLSGGQRQRVAIARALMLEPGVLLLDEPTSALDVSAQAEILNLLMRLRQERHLTYLLVSHDLAVIAQLCERLAVMKNGAVVENLSTARLISGEPRHCYTRQLLAASRGYNKVAVAQFMEFDKGDQYVHYP